MAPKAHREDPGGLHRRGGVEVPDYDDRLNRVAPRPPAPRRVVLRIANDVRDPEDRLPDRRVEDRAITGLH